MIRNKIFITAFVVFLFLPIFGNIFNLSVVGDLFEKRIATTKPEFPVNLSELEAYPKKFNKYYNDNYGFRKDLISINGSMMDKVFNESPDDRVLVGKDGWLYFDNKNSLLDAAGRASINKELINKGVEVFYKNWQNAKKKNMKYLFVIAADKTTIYSQFLPDYFKYGKNHRIDVFKNALLRKYPDFPLVDLRDILLKAKDKEIIYHKTDTHWNKRGAHYGYVEIMRKLNFSPYLREDFNEVENGEYFGDIAQIMGIKQTNRDFSLTKKFANNIYLNGKESKELKQIFHKAEVFEHNNKALPKLFVYKDSFFGELQNLVSEHFSVSLYINEFPCRIDYDILENYSPDYIIQQFWENRIESVLKKC